MGEECGDKGRNRTADTGIFSAVLYRLSYLGEGRPQASAAKCIIRRAGLSTCAQQSCAEARQKEHKPRACRRLVAIAWAKRGTCACFRAQLLDRDCQQRHGAQVAVARRGILTTSRSAGEIAARHGLKHQALFVQVGDSTASPKMTTLR